MVDRLAFGFHNPNHAAALACALLPLCWGWRRAAWLGRLLSLALFLALLTTQSRTGLVVALSEVAMWWRLRKGRFSTSTSTLHLASPTVTFPAQPPWQEAVQDGIIAAV